MEACGGRAMKNQAFRDPSVKDSDSYRVIFNNRICTPDFNSIGAARAYIDLLESGKRKPEYVIHSIAKQVKTLGQDSLLP
jgi:hypothetical protein